MKIALSNDMKLTLKVATYLAVPFLLAVLAQWAVRADLLPEWSRCLVIVFLIWAFVVIIRSIWIACKTPAKNKDIEILTVRSFSMTLGIALLTFSLLCLPLVIVYFASR